jgi:hypothetical protein
MQNILCPRTLLSTTTADALDPFRGRVDQGDWAPTDVVRGFSLVHDSEGSHYENLKDGPSKARLKLKMRWND